MSLIDWLRQESDKTKAWLQSRRRVEKIPWPELEDERVSNTKSPPVEAINRTAKYKEDVIWIGIIFAFGFIIILSILVYQQRLLYAKNAQTNILLKKNNVSKNIIADQKVRISSLKEALVTVTLRNQVFEKHWKLEKAYKAAAAKATKELREASKEQ